MHTKPYPNTFIVGAAKAGTTSLYEYLSQHPQVYMSPVKEPHYFSRVRPSDSQKRFIKPVLDPGKYAELFIGAQGSKIIGEASPSYLSDLDAARRIKKASPDAKIIIILRDPIERAYSHYLMDVRLGIQKKEFFEALIADYRSNKKGWSVSHMYVELGLYSEQVGRYIDMFGNNVIILMFHDLKNNTHFLLDELAVFLEIDPIHFREIDFKKIYNQYYVPRNKFIKIISEISLMKLILKKILTEDIRKKFKNKFCNIGSSKQPIEKEAHEFLKNIYSEDILSLEHKLQKKLPLLKLTME